MSASNAVLDKLDALVDAGNEMTMREVKFAIKYWDDAPRKVRSNVLQTLRASDRIPESIQIALLDVSEKAVSVIGELLGVNAQALVVKKFPEDLTRLVPKVHLLKHIAPELWRKLVLLARNGDLPTRQIRRLSVHSDAPNQLLKLAIEQKPVPKLKPKPKSTRAARVADEPEEQHRPRRNQSIAPLIKPARVEVVRGVAKTVKSKNQIDDFADPKAVVSKVRKIRRP